MNLLVSKSSSNDVTSKINKQHLSKELFRVDFNKSFQLSQ